MDVPLSSTAWRLDGELDGHTPQQTIAYLRDVSDWQDYLEQRRHAWPVMSGVRRWIPWRWRRRV